jgi:hypothetical protein
MANQYSADVPKGFNVPKQVRLDSITGIQNEITLKNLGSGNNLAFKYYEGLKIYCKDEKTEYVWREVIGSETGLLDTHFIYPTYSPIDGINYSGKSFNFFKVIVNSESADGSETKLTAGSNITITGIGTIVNPYTISSNFEISETYINEGNNINITGSGVISDPYIINSNLDNLGIVKTIGNEVISPGQSLSIINNESTGKVLTTKEYVQSIIPNTPDGSETKLNSGNNISITGSGTILNPYIINAESEETITYVNSGDNTNVTGSGSISDPFIINSIGVQFDDLSDIATTGEYSDLLNTPSTKSEFNTELTDGDFLFTGDITQYTNEQAQDAVGNILIDTPTINFTYDDENNTIIADVKPSSINTTHLADNINVSKFVNDSDYATKAYADSLVTSVFRPAGDWDASGNTFPITGTGPGDTIRSGDTYNTNVAGTPSGFETLDVGDNFYALIDNPGQIPANWRVFESNTQQATESFRGTAKIASQSVIENISTTNNIDIVTPSKFYLGWEKIKTVAQTFAAKITFTIAPRFNSTTSNTVPYIDSNKDLVSSTVTPTELGHVSGVTSAIQTQINSKENTSNKQNSLAVDGTNTKYPTVTAVNTGLGLKANLSGGNTFAGIQNFNGTIETGTGIVIKTNPSGQPDADYPFSISNSGSLGSGMFINNTNGGTGAYFESYNGKSIRVDVLSPAGNGIGILLTSNVGNIGNLVQFPSGKINYQGNITAPLFIKNGAPTTNILLAGGGDIAQNTAFNKNFGTTAGTVVEGGTLGTNAYSSTAYLPLSGGTLSGPVIVDNGFFQKLSNSAPVALMTSSDAINGGSSTDFNTYVYGNNPFRIWTNNGERLIIGGDGNATFTGTVTATSYTATSLPVFENNAAASSLSVGQFYRTSIGVLMVKF